MVISRRLKISLACAGHVAASMLLIRRRYSFTTVAERILSFVVSLRLRGEGKEMHLIQPFAIIVIPSWLQFNLPFMPLVRMREQHED
jgi:hypothetical protein